MKYILILALVLLPLSAFATPTSWDYTGGVLQPLQSMWGATVKVPTLTVTTTASSTLKNATAENFSITGKLFANGVPGTNGYLLQTTGTGVQWVATSSLGISGVGGGVTSVDMSVPTGFTISGNPITTTGTLALSFDTGYFVPTTTRANTWDTAFSWGNHASQGYITDGNTGWDNSYGFVTEGQTVGTSTAGVTGEIPYWTGIRTLGSRATTTLTASGALSLSQPVAVLGSSASALTCLTASGSQAGCLSTADWTSFNGRVSSSSIDTLGELETLQGGTNIIQSTEINTSALLSGILGDETGSGNFVLSHNPTLTGTAGFNALTVSATSTLGNATSTNLGVTGGVNFFGGGLKTTANALCIQLTGSADLCDGVDAGGGTGDGVSNWSYNGTRLTASSSSAIGILSTGSSTLSEFNFTNATGTNATTTNLRIANSLNFGGVSGTAWSAFCTSITGGSGLCDGTDDGGSGGSPAGSSGELQYNNASSFGGTSGLSWNSTLSALNILNKGTTTSYASFNIVQNSSTTGAIPGHASSTCYAINGTCRLGGPKIRQSIELFEDFTTETTNAGDGELVVESITGTSAACTQRAISETNRPGMSRCTTGTTATGRADLVSGLTAIALGAGTTTFEGAVNVTTLSDATNRYQLVVGFHDATTANQTDGVYFLYDEGGVSTGSTASPNWQCVSTSNSVRTFQGSGVAVSAGGWDTLTIEVNGAGTVAKYFIDNALVCTLTANIPTGTARAVGLGTHMIKSVGTTARTLDVDYMYYLQEFATRR